MNMHHWEGLTSNLALIIVATLAWSYAEGMLSGRPIQKIVAVSAVAVCSVALLMALPVTLAPGLVFDLRVVPISFTGAFAGPIPACAAAIVALAIRWWHGGIGVWAGMLSIVLACLAGYAGWLFSRKTGQITMRGLVSLAVAAGSANVLCLVVLPYPTFIRTVQAIGVPSFLVSVAAMLCAGALLHSERRRREFARRSQLLHAVVEALPDCLYVKDEEGRFMFANSATAWLMGTRAGEDLIGKSEKDFFPADMVEPFEPMEEKVWSAGKSETYDQTMKFDGSKPIVLQTLKAPLRDGTGAMVGLITHNRDVTANRKIEDELAETHRRLEMALDSMADGLVQFNADGEIIFCNQHYRELFPKTAELRVPGANIADIIRVSVECDEELVTDRTELDTIVRDRSAFVRKPGSNIIHLGGDRWLEARTTELEDGGSLAALTEITDRMRTLRRLEQANEKLAAQAMTDGLTGLSNRRYFDDKLEREFQRAARDGLPLSLILGDVDHFKNFNDAYGHLAGDDCLRLVSRMFLETFAGTDATLARFGGEEFVALLTAGHASRATELSENFRVALESRRRPHAGSPLGVITISLGVLADGRPGENVKSAEDMISLADATLYLAKRKGRNRVHTYEDGTLSGRFAEMRTGVGS